MKKTKGISKYHLDWQVLRAAKLKPLKTVDEKIQIATEFLFENPSRQRAERVINYLEGLAMGYRGKNEEAVEKIEQALIELGDPKNYEWDTVDMETMPDSFSDKDLKQTYKDNFARYKKFALKGYFHRELYDFLKRDAFRAFSDLEEIERLKQIADSQPNRHNFFF